MIVRVLCWLTCAAWICLPAGAQEQAGPLFPHDFTGHWEVDEPNGTRLDGYWRGNRFKSVFSEQDSVTTEVMLPGYQRATLHRVRG
jgi:hypothetical protein